MESGNDRIAARYNPKLMQIGATIKEALEGYDSTRKERIVSDGDR